MTLTTNTLSYLQNPGNVLPMLLIEVPTTLGRTAQEYRRNGKEAGEERIFEESLGAVVWLGGAKMFNSIGDFIGKRVLGLRDLDADVGKDSLRDPFSDVSYKPKTTAVYKFSKIAGSAVLSALALGYAVPQIKKAATNAKREQKGLPPIPDKNGEYKKGWADKLVGVFIKNEGKRPLTGYPNMDNFVSGLNPANSPSFGGGGLLNGILFASHNLENNTAWRLLSTDLGTTSGRVLTSRSKKEGISYGVRDSISSFAYIFAAPIFSSLVRKAAGTPNVHPEAAEVTAQYFKDLISQNGGSVDSSFFRPDNELKGAEKEAFEKLKFTGDGTILLDDFNIQTNNLYTKKAEQMSQLQPRFHSQKILSEKQAQDVLSNSKESDPDFLKKAINAATYGKSDDPKSFISRKNLEKIRDSFDDYALGLEKYAKKKGGGIDLELVGEYTKKLNRKNLAIHLSGVAFAATCLAVIIPKIQYFCVDKLGGKDEPENENANSDKNLKTYG